MSPLGVLNANFAYGDNLSNRYLTTDDMHKPWWVIEDERNCVGVGGGGHDLLEAKEFRLVTQRTRVLAEKHRKEVDPLLDFPIRIGSHI